MSDLDRIEIAGTKGMFATSLKGKREIDEDFVACGDFGGVRVGVICDGMGGGEMGDRASEIVATGFVKGVGIEFSKKSETWRSEKIRHTSYRKIIIKCHEVLNAISRAPGRSGTTITALVTTYGDGRALFADIIQMGDSRCYRIRSDGADLLTEDHTVSGNMHRSGFIKIHEIQKTSGSNSLTRNVGDESGSEPDISSIDIGEDHEFLLCCDGVWGSLHGKDGLWLPEVPICSQESTDSFVKRAIEMGSTDNCSVLAIDTRP